METPQHLLRPSPANPLRGAAESAFVRGSGVMLKSTCSQGFPLGCRPCHSPSRALFFLPCAAHPRLLPQQLSRSRRDPIPQASCPAFKALLARSPQSDDPTVFPTQSPLFPPLKSPPHTSPRAVLSPLPSEVSALVSLAPPMPPSAKAIFEKCQPDHHLRNIQP